MIPQSAIRPITVHELAETFASGQSPPVMDVREHWEIELASLGDHAVVVPMSEMSQRGLDALPDCFRDPSQTIIVMCHHGVRSAQVCAWLMNNGYTDVFNLAGGIDAYAHQVDGSVGSY